MDSIKELARGLMGYHLLNEDAGSYTEPSNARKLIGVFLVLYILLPIILAIPVAIGMCVLLIFHGLWEAAILFLIVAPLAIGIFSIPGWLIIDWEKNHLLSKLEKAS